MARGVTRGIDVESILSDSAWNPEGRDLSLGEKRLVDEELKKFRYFQETPPIERLQFAMAPPAGVTVLVLFILT